MTILNILIFKNYFTGDDKGENYKEYCSNKNIINATIIETDFSILYYMACS